MEQWNTNSLADYSLIVSPNIIPVYLCSPTTTFLCNYINTTFLCNYLHFYHLYKGYAVFSERHQCYCEPQVITIGTLISGGEGSVSV